MPPTQPNSGPGWSLLRVAGLFCLGVAAGAGFGAVVAVAIVVAGSPGPDSVAFIPVAVLYGGVAGAVVAALAGIGSLVGLVVLDHWGERSARARALIAGISAAVAVGVVGAIAAAAAGDPWAGVAVVPVATAAGLAAGGGLWGVERHASRSA